IDLQDVGTRIYTYIYTMAYCLKAAKRSGRKVVVCDRPNPIGGVAVEGPMLASGFESFVGLYPIPMRHGMTIGELARLFNTEFDIGADLEVVAMHGWTRDMYHDEARAPWVLPSPNMPTLDTAIVYPGTVLFEGTNVSEGRGTTRPFELVGAPWVSAERFADALNTRRIPGVFFRPVVFEPTFHKHAKTACGGIQIHVTDRTAFRPVLVGVLLTEAFRAADPGSFEWRQPPYEYEYEKLPFDILAGTSATREQIEGGVRAEEIARTWDAPVDEFRPVRERYLLY
ncbi:MAG: exo-beta-N-acetylmuramidase NamZ domain-containing protein, partial [Geminicoccaceae bacterium]